MTRSMTAYARGTIEINHLIFSVEISSLNRKNLDVHTNFPKDFSFLEIPIRKKISSHCKRGSVSCKITLSSTGKSSHQFPTDETLHTIMNFWKEKQKKFGLSSEISLEFLSSQADKLLDEKPINFTNEQLMDFLEMFEEIIHPWISMKEKEGQLLIDDLLPRLEKIASSIDTIEKLSHSSVPRFEEKIKEKIRKISQDVDVDDDRLAKEIVYFSDKIDINEEIVRIRSHITQFKHLIEKKEIAIGKTLDFLIQELHRETNSLGVKAQELEISKLVIDIKTQLEKIREQVQNIE